MSPRGALRQLGIAGHLGHSQHPVLRNHSDHSHSPQRALANEWGWMEGVSLAPKFWALSSSRGLFSSHCREPPCLQTGQAEGGWSSGGGLASGMLAPVQSWPAAPDADASAGAALSPATVIKVPAQSSAGESTPSPRPWGVLLQQIKNKPSPCPVSLSSL